MIDQVKHLIASRPRIVMDSYKKESEGGCGVIGLACAKKIAGRHLLAALSQMENRGNGKGGGIAAVGLNPQSLGVSQEILEQDYLLAIAYLDMQCKKELEARYIHPFFDLDHELQLEHLPVERFPIAPPEVVIYFVRPKAEAIADFCREHGLSSLSQFECEEEFVYRNSQNVNRAFYTVIGDKRAFVLSHGKNMLVLKMVGYGHDVITYYQLQNFEAHVWIGHHRYPTKGRVWHPGGAHPFIGLHEALVHNGDFANYYSICEYLSQRHIYPHFLTDTEVAVLLFDLLYRTYRYPLEYVIEALAPTTERDFTLLPQDKQQLFLLLQQAHMHGSPDGPWFFLIAQSLPIARAYCLIGITDTSMLRPQVFALQQGNYPIGLAASEKQAIDATLHSLAAEDAQFWSCADYYWNARGGSHTDGGAFSFSVCQGKLSCEDKFGRALYTSPLNPPNLAVPIRKESDVKYPESLPSKELSQWTITQSKSWDYSQFEAFLNTLCNNNIETKRRCALDVITTLMDSFYPMDYMRRSCIQALLQKSLSQLLENTQFSDLTLINAQGLLPEGPDSLARAIISEYRKGARKMIVFNCHGQRFIGNGLGEATQGVEIHVYGSSGDYLASGMDGAVVHVHGSTQDQVAQIMNNGTLIIHGDVGQTFMYGAKGGEAYVRGNTAGRPLINAVGNPRVVINGTCLDYLAESFMAGNPLQGGGFAIINGLHFDQQGNICDLDTPYSGSNLFSLASGGAIYIRDPRHHIVKGQLNGGEFSSLSEHDWQLILPYLEKNERHFGIPISRLLLHQGTECPFGEIYRKIMPITLKSVQDEEAWVKKNVKAL